MIELVVSPQIGPVLLIGGLVAPLIGSLGLAIRRSARRQECAQLRDQLVDAVRTGELDVSDWRVFSLIDWFDRVAATGRTDLPGRHTRERSDRNGSANSVVHSLAAALQPPGAPGGSSAERSSWPEPPELNVGSDLRAIALSYRERHQPRLRNLPRRPVPTPTRPQQPAGLVMPSSLVEEIFAVAGSGR
jgi:hypothetical protein